jgi:ABC-type branched-subunit amino acid transport system ATPase component
MAFLTVQDVTLHFGGVAALQNVSTTMEAGEFRGVIGPNGAGKSTLINVISRFYPPTRGFVHLDGIELTRVPAHTVARHGVARTFQNLELFEAMTVLDNVLVGDHTQQRAGFWSTALQAPWALRDERQARKRAMAALDEVGLAAWWHRPASALSFGQRRLLELARALVHRPRLLLLDEPANGLSPPVLQHFVDVVLHYRERYGMAVLLVEHVIKLVLALCERITVLDNGSVIAEGSPDAIQRDPQVITAYLGQQVAQEARYGAHSTPVGARRLKDTLTPNVDADHTATPDERAAAAQPVLLEVTDVDSYYGKIRILHQASLRVHRGEVVALLGGNGSGKSTMLRTVSGFVQPRRGTVVFAGKPLHGQRPDRIVRQGIIHVPQGREIFPKLTVRENLSMGAYCSRSATAVAQELERVYGYFPILAARAKQYAGYLSGGEQQMLAIGRGLMAHPTLLLLDEPSASLAPLVIEAIFATLVQMNADGITILLVEQNVSAALAIADYVYVLRDGSIVTKGTPTTLQQGETLQQAYLGTDVSARETRRRPRLIHSSIWSESS